VRCGVLVGGVVSGQFGQRVLRRLPRSWVALCAEPYLVILTELWQVFTAARQRVPVDGMLHDGIAAVWIEVWLGVIAREEVSN
jgi:hypothetical protein